MNKSYTKKALSLSIILLVMWGLLGVGTTLAWFTDTTPVKQNTFYTGELDLHVSYKNEEGKYVELEEMTNVFGEEAIYEPGYVQVVYLKIENIGDIPFDYTTAITVNDYSTVLNKFGQRFNLVPYLKYGVVTHDDEDELISLIDTREEARSYALEDLNNYFSDIDSLNVGEETYLALIVTMPEYVGNDANHGGEAPYVKLGINVKASQKGTLN